MQTTLSPKLQPFIKGFLDLSPQEQFQFITIVLQNLFGIQKMDELITLKPQEMLNSQVPIKAGSAKGLITIADDFDEPLEDFKEYM